MTLTLAHTTKTLLWFLRHPRLYPQVPYMALRKFRRHFLQGDTREESARWCADRAVDSQTAIGRLTGSMPVPSIECLYPEVFSRGHEKASECPTVMGGAGDLDFLYAAAEYLKALRVVETGVARGWSSLAILLSLRNREGSRLLSTDMPYPNGNSEEYVGCVVPPDMRSHWTVLKLADRQALPIALKELSSIDMCHYDSDKSYDGRMWAYPRLWKALREGGFLISDDIGDNVAFRDFSTQVGCEPTVLRKDAKYIGILVKPS